MVNVLLCGEGVTDQGRDEYSKGELSHSDGVLQVFIQKLAPKQTFHFSVKSRQDIKNVTLVPQPGKYAQAIQVKARKLAALATLEGCRHIAYHRDEDNRGLEEMRREVHSYFSVAEDAGVRCLAIVPKHMTESWLLSDPDAFPNIPTSPNLPSKPEAIWGKKDADCHPKKYLARVLHQFHDTPSADTYREIAERTSVETVLKKCPESFGRFCTDMKKFLSEGTSADACVEDVKTTYEA